MGKSGDFGRLSADIGTDICRYFGRPTTLCRSTQAKSFVDRSADVQEFCHRWGVGRWSPDDRPIVDRLFEEIYIMKSAGGRPIIGRQSAVDRPTVGWWHFIKEPSADRRRISALFTMHMAYHALILFWNLFHRTSCTSNIRFLCWISNWTIRMTFRNKRKYFTLNITI